MCPHWAHRRRWNHQPPSASHSTQPGPLGGTLGSIPVGALTRSVHQSNSSERKGFLATRLSVAMRPAVLAVATVVVPLLPVSAGLAEHLGDDGVPCLPACRSAGGRTPGGLGSMRRSSVAGSRRSPCRSSIGGRGSPGPPKLSYLVRMFDPCRRVVVRPSWRVCWST